MGLTLDCKTCQPNIHAQVYDLHQISPNYIKRLSQFNEIRADIPNYENEVHLRIVNDLRNRKEKFDDPFFPTHDLLFRNEQELSWKRISEVFPMQNFCRSSPLCNNFSFSINSLNKSKFTQQILSSLLKLSAYPELIMKIFPNLQVSKEGFYALYMCLGGNIQKKVEIVIDDNIPVSKAGKYFFYDHKKGDGIWMILLMKAWAKILRSQSYFQMQSQFYLSEMTGIPQFKLYNKNDYLWSGRYQFQAYQSKYLKIVRNQPIQLVISFWQPHNIDFTTWFYSLFDFVIEVIIEKGNQNQYELLTTSIKKSMNKLIIMGNYERMLVLPKGLSIIHIYNRSSHQRDCNLVVHSRSPVNFYTRTEKEFEHIKMRMIRNQFLKLKNSITIQNENPELELRFCWMKHRGIFCLRNKSSSRKKISMRIKRQFDGEISFEDNQSKQKMVQLKSLDYCFFIVIRNQDKDYGHFYEISEKPFEHVLV